MESIRDIARWAYRQVQRAEDLPPAVYYIPSVANGSQGDVYLDVPYVPGLEMIVLPNAPTGPVPDALKGPRDFLVMQEDLIHPVTGQPIEPADKHELRVPENGVVNRYRVQPPQKGGVCAEYASGHRDPAVWVLHTKLIGQLLPTATGANKNQLTCTTDTYFA